MSIFKKLFGQKNSDGSPSEEKSKYFPEAQLPIDERFTHNFRKNGGKFLYCENLEELNEAFDNILLENDWYEKEVIFKDNLEEIFGKRSFEKTEVIFDKFKTNPEI